MQRAVFILNALMTLSFGAVAYIAPITAFAGFGIGVDAACEPIALGYAAACLGYGIIMALMRNVAEAGAAFTLLVASLVFNALEVVLQAPLAVGGQVGPAIWVTFVGHALGAGLSAFCLWSHHGRDRPPAVA